MPATIIKPYGKKNKVQFVPTGASRAKQSFKDECDINNILAKYQKTGAIEHANKHSSSYGYADSTDFTEAMQTIAIGNSMFEELPSSLRTKFNNDPAEFLEFTGDVTNHDEMVELGLVPTNPNQPSFDAENTTDSPVETEPTGEDA